MSLGYPDCGDYPIHNETVLQAILRNPWLTGPVEAARPATAQLDVAEVGVGIQATEIDGQEIFEQALRVAQVARLTELRGLEHAARTPL